MRQLQEQLADLDSAGQTIVKKHQKQKKSNII